MSTQVNTPAAPPAVAPPQSSSDYQAAVLAELDSGAAPDPAVLAELGGGEGNAPAEPPAAAPAAPPEGEPAEPPVETAPAEEPPAEPKLKGFDALVREKAALRKQQQEMNAKAEKLSRYEKVDQLIAAGDYAAANALLNIPYTGLVSQILKGKADPVKKPETAEPEGELAEIRNTVKGLQEQLQAERAQRTQLAHERELAQMVKAEEDKYPLVAARGAHALALTYLEKYFNETGELPSKDPRENYRIGLEAVEADLDKEASAWEAALTKRKRPATVPGTTPAKGSPKEAVQPAASVRPPQSRTLTNTLGATRSPPPEPQTPEDYQRAALADLENLG